MNSDKISERSLMIALSLLLAASNRKIRLEAFSATNAIAQSRMVCQTLGT